MLISSFVPCMILCILSQDDVLFFLLFTFVCVVFREVEGYRNKETETSIYCSTYFAPSLVDFACALTRDETHNFGALGRCSDQLSCPARPAMMYFFE